MEEKLNKTEASFANNTNNSMKKLSPWKEYFRRIY
jgi:hypothetical protein